MQAVPTCPPPRHPNPQVTPALPVIERQTTVALEQRGVPTRDSKRERASEKLLNPTRWYFQMLRRGGGWGYLNIRLPGSWLEVRDGPRGGGRGRGGGVWVHQGERWKMSWF